MALKLLHVIIGWVLPILFNDFKTQELRSIAKPPIAELMEFFHEDARTNVQVLQYQGISLLFHYGNICVLPRTCAYIYIYIYIIVSVCECACACVCVRERESMHVYAIWATWKIRYQLEETVDVWWIYTVRWIEIN